MNKNLLRSIKTMLETEIRSALADKKRLSRFLDRQKHERSKDNEDDQRVQ